MTRLDFQNTTHLCSETLLELCSEGLVGWSLRPVTVRVRYSRGADFSGTCFYTDRRIYINIGQHVVYPYVLGTNLARAKTVGRRWYKPTYTLELSDGCELALFVFMHELYHLLIKRARRNTRQKESMCDRFAARFLVEKFGLIVRDHEGRMIPRQSWDFQDLERFVAAARDRRAARRPIPQQPSPTRGRDGQLLLFEL